MVGPTFTVPASLKGLGEDAAARVHELVSAAEQQQIAEGERATDAALKIVPRPLRPLIRKVVGG